MKIAILIYYIIIFIYKLIVILTKMSVKSTLFINIGESIYLQLI